jgi:hypothetical protein
MTLQEKLDAFKAEFEAGKPPYNVRPSVAELDPMGSEQRPALWQSEAAITHSLHRSRRHGSCNFPSANADRYPN